jgi:hypothetical protein
MPFYKCLADSAFKNDLFKNCPESDTYCPVPDPDFIEFIMSDKTGWRSYEHV